ncbi:MAG: hypothetical protein AAB501_00575 [Patescibacteria group bacterium]
MIFDFLILSVPPSSTTQEPKALAYKIRTMASDIEALKKGSGFLHSEITIAPSNISQPQIKLSFPDIGTIKRGLPIPESKKLEVSREENINHQYSKPLISPPPLSPSKPQPFETPIKKPIMPPENYQQQQRQAPPLGLPMEPTTMPYRPSPTPMPPPRPLTQPPIQQQQQPPKLPPLPPLPTFRPNLPPLPPIPSKQGGVSSFPSRKGGRGKLVLIGVISVLILSFVAGEIWWFFLRQTPASEQATTQDILPPPQELQPLLPIEQAPATPEVQIPTEPIATGLLSYDPNTQIVDVANIIKINNELVGDNILAKLIIQKSVTDTTTNESSVTEITTLDEIMKVLKIKIPISVKKELSSEFDVFAFGGNKAFDKTECAKIKNSPTSCYGPRLGMAIKVLDSTKISAPLKAWEKTMVTDLKPLVLSKVGVAASPTFQTGTYQNQTIHYKNLPINTITVEYTLIDDVLIITTSKSAILKAIDSVIITNP